MEAEEEKADFKEDAGYDGPECKDVSRVSLSIWYRLVLVCRADDVLTGESQVLVHFRELCEHRHQDNGVVDELGEIVLTWFRKADKRLVLSGSLISLLIFLVR